MKHLLPIVLAGLFSGSAIVAEEAGDAAATVFLNGDTADLSQFVWEKRPVIVFADSPNDPNFGQQMDFLEARVDDLATRDVVVLTDTDPSVDSALHFDPAK